MVPEKASDQAMSLSSCSCLLLRRFTVHSPLNAFGADSRCVLREVFIFNAPIPSLNSPHFHSMPQLPTHTSFKALRNPFQRSDTPRDAFYDVTSSLSDAGL